MPYFDDVILTIKAESDVTTPDPDFSCDALGATLKPATTTTTRNYLCGARTIVSAAIWTLTLEFEQNWLPEGLSDYLFTHAGELATVTIQAATLETEATCTATLAPSDFGGKAGAIAEASIDLGVDGQPVFASFTPAADDAHVHAGADA